MTTSAETTPLPPSSVPSSRGQPLRVDVGSCSDKGCVRSGNEDVAFVAEIGRGAPFDVDAPAEGWLTTPLLFGVCDGMGGAAAGEVASREATVVLGEQLTTLAPAEHRVGAVGRAIVEALQRASASLLALAKQRPAFAGMGTTATVCALVGRQLVIGQVGDSRAYVLRSGSLEQLTRDQTLAQLMVERGQLTADAVEGFFGGHIILQAVGTSDRLDVDLRVVPVSVGDVVLVCSDGLVDALSEEAVAAALSVDAPASEVARALVTAANDAGATDNVTCVVVRAVPGDARPGARSEPFAVQVPPIEEGELTGPPTRRSAIARLWSRLRRPG